MANRLGRPAAYVMESTSLAQVLRRFPWRTLFASCRHPAATAVFSRRFSAPMADEPDDRSSSQIPPKTPVTRFVSVDLKDEDAGGSAVRPNNELDFNNPAEAFARKSTWEIARALCILKMCSVDAFVDNSLSVLKWTRRLFGKAGLRLLVKPTFYKQFVGGETHREIQECMVKLSDSGIRPMLAATMEEDVGDPAKSEAIYNSNCSRILECMELSTAEATPAPMMQMKMTGLIPVHLLVKIGSIYDRSENKLEMIKDVAKRLIEDDHVPQTISSQLEEKETTAFKNAISRLKTIGEEAKARGLRILVDAEYTYVNSGLSLLTLAMEAAYNQDSPLIWNTYQCYLKDAYSKIEEELELTDRLGVHFGAKLVRGAYVLQERTRAQALQVPCPVCDDYQSTNDNFNKALSFLLEHTATRRPKSAFVIATHNTYSIKLAIKKMKELGISNQQENISFGQLYGMSDEITYPLALSGYAVYKSIPYGTLEEVLPYIVRRAVENRTVLAGLRNERTLLWKEMKHRLRIKSRSGSSI